MHVLYISPYRHAQFQAPSALEHAFLTVVFWDKAKKLFATGTDFSGTSKRGPQTGLLGGAVTRARANTWFKQHYLVNPRLKALLESKRNFKLWPNKLCHRSHS